MYWPSDHGIRRAELDGGSPYLLIPNMRGLRHITVDAIGGKIYWTKDLQKDNGKIWRANLDGSNIEDIVPQGVVDAYGITVDAIGEKIYWTDVGADKIQRANLDGSNVTDLVTTGLSDPHGIVVDGIGGKLYWTDGGRKIIQRANLDGSSVTTLVEISGGPDVLGLDGIAVDTTGGKIYWTESHSSKIRRANLDGSNVEDIVTGLDSPGVIAIDGIGGKLYWADRGTTGKIQRANLDGSNVEDILADYADGIALEATGGKIYWTSRDSIHRANLDGSNVEDLYISPIGYPDGIAVDATGGKIYWTDWARDDSTIWRANFNGSNIEGLALVPYPWGIDVDASGGKIYWTDDVGIRRANLDGSNVEDIVTGLDPIGIAVDASGGKVYWADWFTDKIQRANLDGSNVEDLATAVEPWDVAVDASGGKIYWADWFTGKIQRANLDGSNVEDIVTGLEAPYRIAVDGGGEKVYWTNLLTKKVQRANLDGTEVEELVTHTSIFLNFIALDFATTAGAVTLVDEDPHRTWNYRLTHNSGAIERWTYTGATITEASVDGEAAAAGWSVKSQTDTQVVFATTTALTSGTLTGFHITGAAGGTGSWTAGSNSGGVDGALPVELADFNGIITVEGILLRWRTISETNNLGFHLYRSETKDGDYVRVTPTRIKGHGTDSTPHDYSFLDETAEVGKSYWYTIEDMDFAGKAERSDPIQVTFLPQRGARPLLPVQTRVLQNFPNPFNPETWLPFHLAHDADVTLRIYDMRGQVIRTLKLGQLKAGILR